MILHLLPNRAAGAAENMATDFLLLQRYPETAVRFRHYDWHRPAFTFGYSQKIDIVRQQLPTDEPYDLCRRPTGGGIVDHRDDWTYALVIPRGHPLEEVRATQSYRSVHEALASALQRQNIPATVKLDCDPLPEGQTCGAGGVCFQRAELYDVISPASRLKIAGAAQKRNKHGLLFQGSISRTVVGSGVDWELFHEDFSDVLAQALQAEAVPTPWPEFAEGEVDGLTEQYSSSEWNEKR